MTRQRFGHPRIGWRNRSDRIFLTAPTYGSGGYYAESVAVADVNGDGKPDLVVTDQCSDSACMNHGFVGVLLGKGDGTFQPVGTYDSGGYNAFSVAVEDVNGDGKPDLVVANVCATSNCSTGGAVSVLLGNGDGTFQAALELCLWWTGCLFRGGGGCEWGPQAGPASRRTIVPTATARPRAAWACCWVTATALFGRR